jgi:hypothetical protein
MAMLNNQMVYIYKWIYLYILDTSAKLLIRLHDDTSAQTNKKGMAMRENDGPTNFV